MKKVLIVDDSETVRRQVGQALADAGYRIVEASDGAEALERIAEHGDLSAIVLDVNMPRMNGLDMLERMPAGAGGGKVPVLILTTEAQQALIDRAKKAGAKGWVIKPVKMELLVAAVTKLAS